MDLKAKIADDGTTIADIGAWLDGLDHTQRLAEVWPLGRADQRKLYEKAAGSDPVALEHFVPTDREARQEVIHHGRNTLPLPGPFRTFQKRFCRPDDGSGRLFGYNEGAARKWIGPGCFVAVPTDGNDAWEERGPIVIDYYQVPDAPVVDGWPEVIPNHKGLQRLVYHHTRDFMRQVSEHVSIGAAYKAEKSLGHFFVLVRED